MAAPDHETLPPLYAAVLETNKALYNGMTTERLGLVAWGALTPLQQAEALPYILGVYVHRVYEDERMRRLDRHAADTTHTYLDDADTLTLWDAVHDSSTDEVFTDRAALLNVLCEVELLQHRLAMRDTDRGDPDA